ncbi:MAG: adenylosuccinate synthetase [Candidatus Methanomethyliaceae archaeon]|nr:adenylosuccinate synthetase [Candidatus Methanomethyliaceae archaeon]MDW7971280.1 adenylosuccinate synthetase [Nitrososphaerota archaeon]
MRGKASKSPPRGKIAAYLGIADNYEIAVRTGSINAGHTVLHEGRELKLRIIPCAFVNPKTRLLISAGALFNINTFFSEIEITNSKERVGIDSNSGIITNEHIERERRDEFLMKVVGSTGSGVGIATVDRILRIMKLARDYEELTPFITDVASEVHECIDRDGNVLIEGTQGLFLSLYHGTYPYVTSRDVSASGVCSEVGIGPKDVDEVIVVFKSYVTRVGGGPLEGEISEEEALRRGWMEIASVTRRKRRAAPFNFKLAERAIKINSATQIALTKLDALFPECRGLKEYDKLPREAKNFIEEIENKLKIPVTIIGTGPSTLEVIDRRA